MQSINLTNAARQRCNVMTLKGRWLCRSKYSSVNSDKKRRTMIQKQTLLIVFALVVISGCTTAETTYSLKLPKCPPAVAYPVISDAELGTLSDESYSKVAWSIALRDEYINELKAYCDGSKE